jgi:uncharacterized protein (TIGR02284 family)
MTNIVLVISAAAAATGLAACADHQPTPAPGTPAATAAEINADIAALNDLTGVLIDAEALYREAGQIARNPDLKTELATLQKERAALTSKFQTEVRAMGAEPKTRGTAVGFGHRIFADIRSAFDDKQQTAAGEVLRGENYLLDQMNKALANPQVGDEVKSFVRGVIPSVEADRDRVSALVLRFREEAE